VRCFVVRTRDFLFCGYFFFEDGFSSPALHLQDYRRFIKHTGMKTLLFFAFSLSQLFLISSRLPAQDDSLRNIFSRLQQFDPLDVVIETDIKQLKSEAGAEKKWQSGVFKIMKGNTVVFEQKIQVSARGNMRRKTCDFPPVKIRFYEGDLENDSIEDINALKLVIGCRNSNVDDQLVLKECLTYKLYNLFTEESFRVKEASVRIQTPGKKKGGLVSTAFFIESEQELATRLGGRPVKPRIISPKGLDSIAYDRMSLFQFMIGNTDWGAYTRHNMKVIGFKGRPAVAVPYDFDYSGLVAADYAIPSKDLPLQNVQERYYLGLCRSAASYNQLCKEFLAKKTEVLELCNKASNIEKANRRQMQEYLKEFFSIVEDPKRAQKLILENCDKRIRKDTKEE